MKDEGAEDAEGSVDGKAKKGFSCESQRIEGGRRRRRKDPMRADVLPLRPYLYIRAHHL